MDSKPHRNVIGPLVKSQSLYLRSGIEGTRHWDFQSNINSLIKCNNDEIMRVSLTSVNVFNSYRQITADNKEVMLYDYPPGQALNPWYDGNAFVVSLEEGTYTLPELATQLQTAVQRHYPQSTVEFRAGSNSFRINIQLPQGRAQNHVSVFLPGNLNIILGFSTTELKNGTTYVSDRASIPHGIAELVVELYGLTAVEGAAPVSNYTSASDDVDFGHVLAVVPAGPVWERTVFYNNASEFNSFFFSERSVNTLRIALMDRQGRPHTWISHPVGIGLLFETFKRA